MKDYRLIPLQDKNLRYLPAIKENKGMWVYIPTLPTDPDDQDHEPVVSEED